MFPITVFLSCNLYFFKVRYLIQQVDLECGVGTEMYLFISLSANTIKIRFLELKGSDQSPFSDFNSGHQESTRLINSGVEPLQPIAERHTGPFCCVNTNKTKTMFR